MALPPIPRAIKHSKPADIDILEVYRNPHEINTELIQVSPAHRISSNCLFCNVFYPYFGSSSPYTDQELSSYHYVDGRRLNLQFFVRIRSHPSVQSWIVDQYELQIVEANTCILNFMKQLYGVIDKQTPKSFPPVRSRMDSGSISLPDKHINRVNFNSINLIRVYLWATRVVTRDKTRYAKPEFIIEDIQPVKTDDHLKLQRSTIVQQLSHILTFIPTVLLQLFTEFAVNTTICDIRPQKIQLRREKRRRQRRT